MMRANRLAVALLAALGVVAGGTSPAASAEKVAPARTEGAPDYTRSTDRPFDQVFDAVTKAAKGQGFRISGVHRISESLKKEGHDIPPYATIEVCNGRLVAGVLKAEPRLGALMPCRIAVYRHGEQTVVTTVLPSRLMMLFPEKPEVKKAAAEVDRVMKAIIDEATGAGGGK